MKAWISIGGLSVMALLLSASQVSALDAAQGASKKQEHGVVSTKIGEDSKLPLPRFASLRAKETNLRSGPGKRYPILWVYKQGAVPVEIIDEVQNWRRVRDVAGDSGWLHRSLLSGNRTAMFVVGLHNVYANPDATTAPILRVREGVIIKLEQCTAQWCHIDVNDRQGWVQKTSLFGVYPSEVF
jgi:SH3-like domain-containing protein